MAVDSSGNLFFSDSKNHRIRRVDSSTQIITRVAGALPPGFSGDAGASTAAVLNAPQGVDIDAAGDLFIADNENDRIRKVNASTGVITTVAGNGTPGFSGDGGAATGASLHEPHDIVVDSSGNLFFSDAANDRIRRVDDSTGVITTFAGTGTAGFSGDGAAASAAQIDTPTFLALDASGNLFVADAGNKRVRKISA